MSCTYLSSFAGGAVCCTEEGMRSSQQPAEARRSGRELRDGPRVDDKQRAPSEVRGDSKGHLEGAPRWACQQRALHVLSPCLQLPLRSRTGEGLHPQETAGRRLRIHLRRKGPPDEGRGVREVWHLQGLGEEAQGAADEQSERRTRHQRTAETRGRHTGRRPGGAAAHVARIRDGALSVKGGATWRHGSWAQPKAREA